jgi:hypothetical protein
MAIFKKKVPGPKTEISFGTLKKSKTAVETSGSAVVPQ